MHYLPHRAVIKEQRETTKFRVVFDASCGINGPSLNECLYSGPNMLGKIFDILLRFRLNRIAFTVDIKQAFFNVGVHPEHRDFLRFFCGTTRLTVARLLFIAFYGLYLASLVAHFY